MDEKGSLGLYISRGKATAVWVSADTQPSVKLLFHVVPQPGESQSIALQAARTAMQQAAAFGEVFAAIDCGCYTQYFLHSEFEDYAQVAGTIKYDAEEAAAADAANLAVAFDITGRDSFGSKVTVYAADRQYLTDILMDLQEGGLDPTYMEPDAVCLGRALCQLTPIDEQADALFVILSEPNCYLIRPKQDYAPTVRTFLAGQGQDITAVLAREVVLLAAAEEAQNPLTTLVLIGRTDAIDKTRLHQRTGLEIKTETPEKSLGIADAERAGCYELLAAYGAALAGQTRGHKADFRQDFMPYQGRRKMLVGSLRTISISLTVLLTAVALFFQLKAFQMRRYVSRMSEKTLLEHKAVTYGKLPPRGMTPSSNLRREYTRAKEMEEGLGPGDEKSVPAKLTFFFEAVSKTPPGVDINIQQITITERSMKVKGDTNNKAGTMALFNEINKHPRISLTSERTSSSPDGRDTFEITIEPKK
ncbi:MAG TPA: hypothetical protein PKV53_03345 [Anaerohalosphaeraceae bacterium]|nr:hypothetical protein [Anaerohalosphaeraceae bacterium]HPO69325.1 hypothetical protein [Anaerohalosphaeraceae bacterium]